MFSNTNDVTPNSLKNSNVSLKVKTMKEEGVEVCSLVRNTSKVKGVCWGSGMGIRTSDKWVNYSHRYAQTK
jgi:hypothetical protein